MSQKNNPQLIILITIFVVVILGGIILGVVMNSSSGDNEGGAAELAVNSFRYDFGDVSMAQGLVSHTFKITNEGTADLKLTNISTSCMCTVAVLVVDGERSPKFGMHNNPAFWSKELKPSQSADLEVTFDPNAHGPNATGPITRSVKLFSNDGGKSNVRSTFTFTANVVK
jgi:hypothetical protein